MLTRQKKKKRWKRASKFLINKLLKKRYLRWFNISWTMKFPKQSWQELGYEAVIPIKMIKGTKDLFIKGRCKRFTCFFSSSKRVSFLTVWNWQILNQSTKRVHVPQKIIIFPLAFCQFCPNYLDGWSADSFENFLKVYYRNFSVVLGKDMVPSIVFWNLERGYW